MTLTAVRDTQFAHCFEALLAYHASSASQDSPGAACPVPFLPIYIPRRVWRRHTALHWRQDMSLF